MLQRPFHALDFAEQERIREEFLCARTLPRDLDVEVARSWQRCANQGRDPHEHIEPPHLDRASLAIRHERAHELLTVAKPLLQSLFEAVGSAGCGVLLMNDEGVVLASRLPSAAEARLAALMQPGVMLNESTVGTNAMAAAMHATRPVRVFGAEHYFENTRCLYCCAAPIFDASGVLIGALDVTGLTAQAMNGALALIMEAAATIERQLVERSGGAIHLKLGLQESSLGAPGPLVALHEDGAIAGANQAARKLLFGTATDPADHSRLDSVIAMSWDRARALMRGGRFGMTLSNGLYVRAFAELQPAAARSTPRVGWPDFGDSSVAALLPVAVRALNQGLPVLLRGETGTGKEVAARALHAQSARHAGPFVAINCAAIPEGLIESELFGHAEGAFTGARRGGMPGHLELADGGTLFLDEIGDMPLGLQTRFLRVLDQREVFRLGSTRARKIDIAVISATHCDLEEALEQRQFRSDLFHRLKGLELRLPALRQRDGLASWLRMLFEREVGPWQRLCVASQTLLLQHLWPGNAREALHVMRYLAATAPSGGSIEPADLPPLMSHKALRDVRRTAPKRLGRGTTDRAVATEALRACDGHVATAARSLGISRATLYRRLQAWDCEPSAP